MKRLGLIGLSVIVAASLSTVVMAQEEGHAKKAAGGDRKAGGVDRFKQMDTNADGKISLDEFKAAFAKIPAADAEKKFANADTDKDGFLTPEELKAAHGTREKKGAAAAPAADAPVAPAP